MLALELSHLRDSATFALGILKFVPVAAYTSRSLSGLCEGYLFLAAAVQP